MTALPATHSRRYTAAVFPDDGAFCARCIEVEVASQGDTVEEALASLKEALELYCEDPPLTPPPDTPRRRR